MPSIHSRAAVTSLLWGGINSGTFSPRAAKVIVSLAPSPASIGVGASDPGIVMRFHPPVSKLPKFLTA